MIGQWKMAQAAKKLPAPFALAARANPDV